MNEIKLRSVSEDTHDAILKYGMDHLIRRALEGKDVGEKMNETLGRAYVLDKSKYSWHMDYQINAMKAMKKGGLL